MRRRDISKALFATAAGSTAVVRPAEAQSCTAPCYAQTAAEIAASVTPVNYAYPPGHVLRYGTNTSPGTTDMWQAFQNALTCAGFGNYEVYAPAGLYLLIGPPSPIGGDLAVPVGAQWIQGGAGPFAINIRGDGSSQTIIKFSSTGSFTRGFYANGNGQIQMGPIFRDLQFYGNFAAPTAITFRQTDRAQVRDCIIRDFNAGGMFVDSCVATRLSRIYFSGCGSASVGVLEIDGSLNNSTTTVLDQVYVSGGNAGCLAALRIDRAASIKVTGGAYESAGTPIMIGSKITSGTVTSITIEDIDMENPGNGNVFIDIGAGLTGGALVENVRIEGTAGFPSGTTSIPYAIRMQNCTQIHIADTLLVQPTGAISYIEMVGTNISGVVVDEHRGMAGTVAWAWARFNGSQIKSWGPWLRCVLGQATQSGGGPPICQHPGLRVPYVSSFTLSGTGIGCLINNAVGGYVGLVVMSNSSATTVPSLQFGEPGMEIEIIAADNNTTLTFGNSGGAFRTISGANLTMVAGKAYKFVNDGANGAGGSCWVQL